MYHYPFSNVDSSGSLCIGANTLPKYKELRKAAGLPALLLSIPNNFDRFDPSDNQLGLDYRDLMQHLKDKEPAYYYTDILIPNGQTLAPFYSAHVTAPATDFNGGDVNVAKNAGRIARCTQRPIFQLRH